MTRRFVDLSITLDNDVVTDPPFMRPKITYQLHAETVAEAGFFFEGIRAEDFPGGMGFAAAEWCFQPGVRLDFRHFADGYVASGSVAATLRKKPSIGFQKSGGFQSMKKQGRPP